MTGDNPQMTRISYGGDYNPEQWPEQVRADDVVSGSPVTWSIGPTA